MKSKETVYVPAGTMNVFVISCDLAFALKPPQILPNLPQVVILPQFHPSKFVGSLKDEVIDMNVGSSQYGPVHPGSHFKM